MSMQMMAVNQESIFENARTQARNLAVQSLITSRFKLLNGGNSLVTRAVFLGKLDGLSHDTHSSLYKATAVENTDRSLYLFSDFQRSATGKELMGNLGDKGKTVLVPVLSRPASNIYIDSIWLDDAFVRPQTNVGLHLQLRNGGTLVAQDCPVKVFLGQRQVAAFRVTVEPGQSKATVVQVQLGDNTLALGRVVTEDTEVTFDNVFYFTLQPAAEIRVLEIGDKPVTQGLYANESLFNYSFVRSGSVNYTLMRDADLVLVQELKEVEVGIRDGLRAVLKRGGSVVIVPSADPTGRGSYQTLFKDLGLGAVQWEQQASPPELREVAMPNSQEPFFREVFGAQQRAVTMPRVAPVLRWARTGTDILRLRDGESYLANFTSGAGQVYVFSAPFSKQYSDFASHALFVPVMYRMAMLSYRNEQLPAYRLSQKAVALQLGASLAEPKGRGPADEAGYRFVKDSLTLIPAQRIVGQQVRLELPVGMNAAGFYQVQRGGKVLTTLAFNQRKQESELAVYSAAELRQLVGPNNPNVRVLEGVVDGENLAQFRAEQTGQPLWRYFVALALACLLAEALLVRFGARRKPAAKIIAA